MKSFVTIDLDNVYRGPWIFDDVQYPSTIFDLWSPAELAAVGIYKVTMAEVITPPNHYVSDYTYEIQGDVCIATPVFVDNTQNNFEALRSNLLSDVSRLEEEAITKGAPFDFGEGYGVLHIQLRDGDRTNLLGIRMKSLSNPEFQTYFRTFENINVLIDAAKAIEISDRGLEGFVAIKGTAWQYKDIVEHATDESQLPVLPESFSPVL